MGFLMSLAGRAGLVVAMAFGLATAAEAKVEANASFAPATGAAGTATRLSVILQNSDPVPATGASIALTLPPGFDLSGTGTPSSTCGGAVGASVTGGQVSFGLTGGTIPAAVGQTPGSCQVSVSVSGQRAGVITATIPEGALKASASGAEVTNGASAQVSFTSTMTPISVTTKTSNNGSVQVGETVARTYTLGNANQIGVSGLTFRVDMTTYSDYFRAASTTASRNTCGGAFTVTEAPPRAATGFSNATIVTLSGATIAAKASCEIEFPLTTTRLPGQSYVSMGQSTQLPTGVLTTDQGVSNAQSSNVWNSMRGGVQTEMAINGAATATVTRGETATVTIVLKNWDIAPSSTLTVPISVPAALTVTDMDGGGCGAMTRNATNVTFTGALRGAPPYLETVDSGDCHISFKVSGTVRNTYTIRMPGGTFSGTYLSGATVTANVNSSLVTADLSFDKTTILSSDTVRAKLRLTNINPAGGAALTAVRVTNRLSEVVPEAIGVAGSWVTSCGGAASLSADAGTVTFSGMTIPAASSCDMEYDVIMGSGAFRSATLPTNNTIGPNDISYTLAGVTENWGSTVSAPVFMENSSVLDVSMSPVRLNEGGVTRATITLTKSSNYGRGLKDIGVSIVLTEGLSVSSPANFTTTCGGVLLSATGDTQIRTSGGSLAVPEGAGASATCTMGVNLRAPTLPSGVSTINAMGQIYLDAYGSSRRSLIAQDPHIVGPAGYARSARNKNVTIEIGKFSLPTSIAFANASIAGGGVTRINVTVSNAANNFTLTDVSVPIDLSGTGLRLSATPDPRLTVVSGSASTCSGATFQATPSSNSLVMSGARILQSSSCMLSFAVNAISGGNHTVTLPAGTVMSSEGLTNPQTSYATLTVSYALFGSAGFEPGTVAVLGDASLVIEIINTQNGGENGAGDYHGASPSLLIPLPSWLTQNGAPTNTCGGETSVTSGSVRMDGGTFVASSPCQIVVPVRAASPGVGTLTVPSGAISTVEGVTNPAEFGATLRMMARATISRASQVMTTGVGQAIVDTFTLRNPNGPGVSPGGMTGVGLSMGYGSGASIPAAGLSTTCAGMTLSSDASGEVSASGGSIPANGSCDVTVRVSSGTPVQLQARTPGVISVETGAPLPPAPADATLRFAAPPVVSLTTDAAPDSEIPFGASLVIANPNPYPIGIGSPGLVADFPDGPGLMRLTDAQSVMTTCVGGSASASGDLSRMALSGGEIPGNGECAVSGRVVAAAGGDYEISLSDLLVQYGPLPQPDPTLSVAATTAALNATKSVRVISRGPMTAEECAAADGSEADDVYIPGSCVEFTVTVANPSSQRKSARDVSVSQDTGLRMGIASHDRGGFDEIVQTAGAIRARRSEIAPGESASFRFRAVIR